MPCNGKILNSLRFNFIVTFDAFDSNEPEMTEPPLFYPNHFALKMGLLGYQLNRSDMDIEFRLYDMRGYEI